MMLAAAHAIRIAALETVAPLSAELVELAVTRVASRHTGMRAAVLAYLRTVLVLFPDVGRPYWERLAVRVRPICVVWSTR